MWGAGSEELSLEEEVAMQEKWTSDKDKATFIVLVGQEDGHRMMIGDVNLFFYEDDPSHAEINVMIAEAGSRRKVLGSRV